MIAAMNHIPTSEQQAAHKSAEIPAALADVALIDAKTCAATGGMSESWWHGEVRAGRAPKPAMRATRCTRWRLADVRKFWVDFAQRDHAETAATVVATVNKAGAAAKAARAYKRSMEVQ